VERRRIDSFMLQLLWLMGYRRHPTQEYKVFLS
jgi:hypothetical protein